MDARFEVVVALDAEEIAREGARRGFTKQRAHESLLADVENTLFDVLRHKSGVARVGVQLTDAQLLSPTMHVS